MNQIPNYNENGFSQRLQEAIGSESIRKFSERCKLSPATISNYINGQHGPSLENIEIIAKAAKVDIAWLAFGGGNEIVDDMDTNNHEAQNEFTGYTDFGLRLREVISKTSIKSFSAKSGLGTTTLNSYMKGTSYPTLDRLSLIASTANVSFNWLSTGNDYKAASAESTSHIKIPHFNIQASAGAGSELVEIDSYKNTIGIHTQTLLDHGLTPENLMSMYVRGDSMEPSLFDGDAVLIKKVVDSFSVLEGVYIFRIHSEIFIKRIQFNKYAATLKVDSDNAFYDSYIISGSDLNDVEIIGEVVCTIFSKIRRFSRVTDDAVAIN